LKVIRDILLDPASRFSSYFDLCAVEKILNEHAAGVNRERHIFLLLSIHYWMAECLGTRSRTDRSATAVKA
jgi:malate synthase